MMDNIEFKPFEISDIEKLIDYFEGLSTESKKRFGPHPFTKEAITKLHQNPSEYLLCIAREKLSDEIIAYTIIKTGWLDFDANRLKNYLLTEKPTDCTLAPSVADDWQSKGVGSKFFIFLLNFLKANKKIERIFLWGGVQINNTKAIAFYKKFGFHILGNFEHNGNNLDMILEI